MLAARYGFQRVVGVEFAVDICDVAERNLAVFRDRTGMAFESRILNIDAATYDVAVDDGVFFLYNPFDQPVLEVVLGNIRRSYEATPRPIHVIYARPLHRAALDADPFWKLMDDTDLDGLEDFAYYQPR